MDKQLDEECRMQLTLDDDQTKALLKEVLVEMLQQQREVFYELVLEALEDVGLAKAIEEGEETEFVDESEIQAILRGEA
jgi:hypothetical protein